MTQVRADWVGVETLEGASNRRALTGDKGHCVCETSARQENHRCLGGAAETQKLATEEVSSVSGVARPCAQLGVSDETPVSFLANAPQRPEGMGKGPVHPIGSQRGHSHKAGQRTAVEGNRDTGEAEGPAGGCKAGRRLRERRSLGRAVWTLEPASGRMGVRLGRWMRTPLAPALKQGQPSAPPADQHICNCLDTRLDTPQPMLFTCSRVTSCVSR